jgi:hypothetical protein
MRASACTARCAPEPPGWPDSCLPDGCASAEPTAWLQPSHSCRGYLFPLICIFSALDGYKTALLYGKQRAHGSAQPEGPCSLCERRAARRGRGPRDPSPCRRGAAPARAQAWLAGAREEPGDGVGDGRQRRWETNKERAKQHQARWQAAANELIAHAPSCSAAATIPHCRVASVRTWLWAGQGAEGGARREGGSVCWAPQLRGLCVPREHWRAVVHG